MMAISFLSCLSDFCRLHFPHFTYPRLVLYTLNEPQNMHFLPLKKLAAQLKMLFRIVTIRIFYSLWLRIPLITYEYITEGSLLIRNLLEMEKKLSPYGHFTQEAASVFTFLTSRAAERLGLIG